MDPNKKDDKDVTPNENGDNKNGKTPPADNNGGKGGDDDKNKDASIPKHRFDEVNEKKKAAEAKVAEYEAKEAKAKADAEEAEKKRLEEQGKHEELIKQQKSEISELKKANEKLTTDNESMTAEFNKMVDGRVESITKDMDEDTRQSFHNLLGEGSAAEKMARLPDLEKAFVSQKNKKGDPGSGIPQEDKDPSTMTPEERRRYVRENR